MFNIEKRDVLLTKLTTRTENHGDEDKPAASLKCEITLRNSALDQFDPKLLTALYEARDKDQAEMAIDDLLPDLKFPHIKPLSWDAEYPEYRVLLLNARDPSETNYILADCTLKAFSFALKDGGSVTIGFTINCTPSGEAIGWLYEQQKHNCLMTIEPPEETVLQDFAGGLDLEVTKEDHVKKEGPMDNLELAIEFLRKGGEASIPALQKRYEIGYREASVIFSKLKLAGWIGPTNKDGIAEFSEKEEVAS